MAQDQIITTEQRSTLQHDIDGLKQTLTNVTQQAEQKMGTIAKQQAGLPPEATVDAEPIEGTSELHTAGFREITAEDEFAANEAIVAEREQEITKIAQDVVTVRELFADVAELVREQG